MARIESLSILTQDAGKEFLSELYGKVIEGLQRNLISARMKNTDLSGNPTSGSVEAKRFVNAQSQDYGTARAAGAGNKVKAKPVTVAIDTDKEIVEEMENKDITLYGVEGTLERRARNHILRMATNLERDFFKTANDAATVINQTAFTDIAEELEAIIQECENTQNDFVDGVSREMMHLVLSTNYYGRIRNDLDKQTNNANVNTAAEEFKMWHGVKCYSSTHLPKDCKYILMVEGAVAQPVMSNQYTAEKIGLSEAFAVSLFYHYGTKAVTPDLIFRPGVFTKADTFKAGTQYYTEKDGAYTACPDTLSSFAAGTSYYTMG